MSVARAQQEIDSSEFLEWMVYESMEPGEPIRGDYQAAMIACTIANANRTKKTREFKLKDFLLKFIKPRANRTEPQELKHKLKMWMTGHNATVDSRKRS
jgi:hypothetical protein